MTTYVALLRGINVGGHSKVAMPALRAEVERLGCKDVSTYINSGNVLLRDGRAPDELGSLIEASLAERLGVPAAVMMRDLDGIRSVCDAIPGEWANDAEQRTDVLFLAAGVEPQAVLESVGFDPSIEKVLRVPGAVVCNVDRANRGRGSLVKIVGTDVYRRMTVRNVNTVRRVRELMEGIG